MQDVLSTIPENPLAREDVPCQEAPTLPPNPDLEDLESNSHREVRPSHQNQDPANPEGKPHLMVPSSPQITNPTDPVGNSCRGMPFSPQTPDCPVSEDLEKSPHCEVPPSPGILVPYVEGMRRVV